MTNDSQKLLNAHQLAALFTEKSPMTKRLRRVSTRLVNSWYERRASTGFPEPKGTRRDTFGRYPNRVWDVDEAMEWFLTWEPKRGGAPKGNRNGYRHGRFAGVRAAAAAKKAKQAKVAA